MTGDWRDEARRLRAQRLSYGHIARVLGRPKSAVWRACNPDRAREMHYRYNHAPGRQEAKNASAREHRPRCECGAPMARHATRCMPCNRAAEAALKDRVVTLWAAGMTTPEIATEIGWTTRSVRVWISTLRAAGYDLPYRRPDRVESGRRLGLLQAGAR